jgi:hypothetical protein
MTRFIVRGVKRQLSSLPVQIELQCRHPGGDIRFGKLQLAAFVIELGTSLPL